VLLGNLAQQHPAATELHRLAEALAKVLGARLGFTMEAANSVGGYLANALPAAGGLNARAMLESPRHAYLLVNVEPELDGANPRQALRALAAADFVVALTPFATRAIEYADVVLPVSPFTETSGTFVSCEGRAQSFNGVVRPLGETRPAWRVLRVLGTMLGLPGFDYQTSEAIRDEVLAGGDLSVRLSNAAPSAAATPATTAAATPAAPALERIFEVPIYFADSLVRRSEPLQKTADAQPPRARMNGAMLARLGVVEGQRVRVRQDGGEVVVEAARDETVPTGCVRLAAAHPSTAALGHAFAPLTIEAT
jgi:NADH-quinone oxidoreductase subunit G